MKWVFYVIVFVYMFYRAVYGENDPLIVGAPKYGGKNYLSVGSYVSISCQATIKNQRVEWLDPNYDVVTSKTDDRIYSQVHFSPTTSRGRSPALMLTITSAKVEDSGYYYCRIGDFMKNVSICILDPVKFEESETEVTVDLGRSITLVCPAKGDPEPIFTWEINGVAITDENASARHMMTTRYTADDYQGQLTIISVEPEASGVYTCVTIQQSLQNDECQLRTAMKVTLNVRYPPMFDVKETKVFAQSNQDVELKCSVDAYPEATYKWFKELIGSRQALGEGEVEFSDGRNQTVLVVNPGSKFGQTYVCQATNEFGATEKFFTLEKLERPEQPSEVTLLNANATAIDLNIQWDSEAVFPVDNCKICPNPMPSCPLDGYYTYIYSVEFQCRQQASNGNKFHKSSWDKDCMDKKFDIEETVSDLQSGINVTLRNLQEETNYQVSVRAVNSAGKSPWSLPVDVATVSESSTEAIEVTTEVEHEEAEQLDNADLSNTTFYGIFFAGGILAVAVVFMFVMRMV